MYVARYWRMQASRYKLECSQYEDETFSLQDRPIVNDQTELDASTESEVLTTEAEPATTVTAA